VSSKLNDYDYALSNELIATRPLAQRDASRMMVVHRESEKIEHRNFRDLKEFIEPDDLLVLNDTRVLTARKFSDDGAVEFLFLEKVSAKRWKCLVRPGRKMRAGATAKIDNVTARVEEILSDGERVIGLNEDVDLFARGSMPLPPYLKRESDALDVEQYQTVFAREPGAIAAPTAGLHFTPEMLREVPHTFVTLHVGPGTFRPVHAENIVEHKMHAERFWISEEASRKIDKAKRVVAVGTTVVRVLESAAEKDGDTTTRVPPIQSETDIFIYPPFEFRVVDALLTNFHLPRSTLLMLVSAFASREFILRAYAEAIRQRYRFYSYGDCMLIL
jgi:S-adenosylmethionine:tRNA ribosyltransferase-isomerase